MIFVLRYFSATGMLLWREVNLGRYSPLLVVRSPFCCLERRRLRTMIQFVFCSGQARMEDQ